MTTGRQDSYADELERRKQLDAWKARKRAEAEARDRAQKQADLEAYLKRRADAWVATVGSTEGLNEELPRWRRQYLDTREAEAQAEREAKLAQAEAEHYDFNKTLIPDGPVERS